MHIIVNDLHKASSVDGGESVVDHVAAIIKRLEWLTGEAGAIVTITHGGQTYTHKETE